MQILPGGVVSSMEILFMEKDLVAAYVRNCSAGKINPLQKRRGSHFTTRIAYSLSFMEMPQLNPNVKARLTITLIQP